MGMLSVGEKLWFINHSVYIGQQNRHVTGIYYGTENSIRMIQIQPQINEIKYKHAGDKDRIADEQMELFKKAHYSPMLGMVPMLLQIPLVLGLINVIYNPMQHLMHIKTSVCDQIVAATCSLMGVDQLGSGAQLQAMAALQNPDNLSFSRMH